MKMTYKMFLDDERYPISDDWVIVRSFDEAVEYISENGYPNFVAFDHDLGYDEKTGFDFAKWLVETDLDIDWWTKEDSFMFGVHSQNPVGAKNIVMLLCNYMKQKFRK